MKLRQLPEDFKVRELTGISIQKDGPYALYVLEKKGLETSALINYLSKKYNISRKEISVAAMKDRHAITTQYLALPASKLLKDLKEENFSLKKEGFLKEKLKPGDLLGNHFEITARDIEKEDFSIIQSMSEEASRIGVPNYFDSQRFGSAIEAHFIAKDILKQDYEKGVHFFLTSYTKHEKKDVKNEKRAIAETWPSFNGIKLKNRLLFSIVREYKRSKDWKKAYLKIPYALRETFFRAYQSYLWNECVKELIQKTFPKEGYYSINYNVGTLMFFRGQSAIQEDFPLIGPSKAEKKGQSQEENITPLELEIEQKVLKREGLTLAHFTAENLFGHNLPQTRRKVVIKPTDLKISSFQVDELNSSKSKERYKMVVSFSLTKGSYATLITKKLFGH